MGNKAQIVSYTSQKWGISQGFMDKTIYVCCNGPNLLGQFPRTLLFLLLPRQLEVIPGTFFLGSESTDFAD